MSAEKIPLNQLVKILCEQCLQKLAFLQSPNVIPLKDIFCKGCHDAIAIFEKTQNADKKDGNRT